MMYFHCRRSSFHSKLFHIFLHSIFIPLAFTVTTGPFVNLLVQNNSRSDEKFGSSAATVSVECKEPLMGSNSWECGIMEETILGGNFSTNDGAWEEMEQGERNLAQQLQRNLSDEMLAPQIRAGPIQLFYSNKVNRSTGQLFISALLRWDFDSQFFHSAYKVFLRIEQEDLNGNNVTSNDGEGRLQRLFTIPMAPINNGTLKNGKSQRVELIVRLDGLFQFGNSYRLKIISSLPNEEEGGKKTAPRPLIAAQTRIQFAELPDELDTAICPNERGINDQNIATNEFDLELLAQRQALASRWTGSFRSVEFFPLHSVINVTFFGAPPSHCIPGYRVQLWLLNSFQTEKLIRTEELVREGPGIFVGAVEFRKLLKGDGRLKYRIKLLPIEQWEGNNGNCVCKLEGKCGCVQVYTNSFTMLNPIETDSAVPTVLAPPGETVASSDSGGRSPLTILLACLLLALTLVLLSFALLLLILRNGNRMGRKRRTLLIFRKSQKGGDELGGLVGGRKSQMSNGNGSSAIPNIKSVLLLNAQPGKRPELERFARLLVKNGVRVFYDRWDRISIERNLQFWVHQAITKADKAVLFWDQRAEKLLNPLSDDNGVKLRIPKSDSSNSSDDNDDLFDRVFCALHQQLDPEKTIYVKWDESNQIDDRPIGSISETVFLFHRDLKLIYAALKIPITEQELREFEHRNMLGRTPQNRPESLLVLIPKFAKKKIPEKMELLTHIEGNNERERNIEETLPEGNEERDEGIYSGTYAENLTIKKPEIMPEKELDKNGKIEENDAKYNEQNDAAQFDSGIESALHL